MILQYPVLNVNIVENVYPLTGNGDKAAILGK